MDQQGRLVGSLSQALSTSCSVQIHAANLELFGEFPPKINSCNPKSWLPAGTKKYQVFRDHNGSAQNQWKRMLVRNVPATLNE